MLWWAFPFHRLAVLWSEVPLYSEQRRDSGRTHGLLVFLCPAASCCREWETLWHHDDDVCFTMVTVCLENKSVYSRKTNTKPSLNLPRKQVRCVCACVRVQTSPKTTLVYKQNKLIIRGLRDRLGSIHIYLIEQILLQWINPRGYSKQSLI